jgi:hypothetical protein
MRGMHHYDHPGYGYRHWHGGMFFLPIIPIVFGLFMLGFIFKTGLWLPLLIGFVVWRMVSHRHYHDGMGHGPFVDMEKRKRDFRGSFYDEGDKPKRRDYGDYI